MPALLAGFLVPLGPFETMTGAVVEADGCIAFRDDSTGSTAPLLWPLDTIVSHGDHTSGLQVVLANGSVIVDAPLTMQVARIKAAELGPGTTGMAECAPDPEQQVIVVSLLPGILTQQ